MEIRPLGYVHETRDCTIRAISICLNKNYEEVHTICKKYGRKDRHGFQFIIYYRDILKDLGYTGEIIKRSGSIAKLIRQFPNDRILVRVREHLGCIISGIRHDLRSEKLHVRQAIRVKQNEYTKA